MSEEVLNLCAGLNPVEGAINTDIHPIRKDYYIHDLNKPFPKNWKNKFDKIIAKGALNYIQPQNFFKVMEELHRILKPNGILKIKARSVYRNPNKIVQHTHYKEPDMRYFEEHDYYNFLTTARYKILNETYDEAILIFFQPKNLYWTLRCVK